MTVATMIIGLIPVLWSTGTGADVMKRIAAPMVGGLVTTFLLELTVYPCTRRSSLSGGGERCIRGSRKWAKREGCIGHRRKHRFR